MSQLKASLQACAKRNFAFNPMQSGDYAGQKSLQSYIRHYGIHPFLFPILLVSNKIFTFAPVLVNTELS
jgi:hypothetical protein